MEIFNIDVVYKNREMSFPGQLVEWGYTHRIIIQVNDIEVRFEPDEERNYRAIVNNEHLNSIDPVLVKLLAEEIEKILH